MDISFTVIKKATAGDGFASTKSNMRYQQPDDLQNENYSKLMDIVKRYPADHYMSMNVGNPSETKSPSGMNSSLNLKNHKLPMIQTTGRNMQQLYNKTGIDSRTLFKSLEFENRASR